MSFTREAEMQHYFRSEPPRAIRVREIHQLGSQLESSILYDQKSISALNDLITQYPYTTYEDDQDVYNQALRGLGQLTQKTVAKRLAQLLLSSSQAASSETQVFSLTHATPSFGYSEDLFASYRLRERWEKREGMKEGQWYFLQAVAPTVTIAGKEFIQKENALPLSPKAEELENVLAVEGTIRSYSAVKKTRFQNVFVAYEFSNSRIVDTKIAVHPL